MLVALLWYAKPGELVWLAGSLAGLCLLHPHVLVRDAAEMTG
jgi:hypothetical protein